MFNVQCYNFDSIQNQDETLETYLFMQDLQNLYRTCRFYLIFKCITHIFIYLYSVYLQISIKMQKVSHRVEMSDYPEEIDGVQLFYFGYFGNHPANIDFLENSSRSTRKRCEICSKLAIKAPEMTTFSCFFC